MEQPKSELRLKNFESRLRETKIVDDFGKPLIMYNRSKENFEHFELGRRNVNKKGVNKFGFFFTDNPTATHYGEFVKARYLNIKNPLNIKELGAITTYKEFRRILSSIGISDKELAGYDLHFQELNIERNKKMGFRYGLNTEKNMYDTRVATFNFFDAGNGFYLRKLLEEKGYDGIIFEDEGNLTAVAFNPNQIIGIEEGDPERQ